jgi:hypothetical protein
MVIEPQFDTHAEVAAVVAELGLRRLMASAGGQTLARD